VVATPAEADIAILRVQTPFQPHHPEVPMAALFHFGDLDFKEPELSRILEVTRQAPTVVDIYLDRPGVIPEIAEHSAALLANFGASDAALLDVVFGKVAPEGTLPFELPSSMEAVRAQRSDVPFDTKNPLFPFGYGLHLEPAGATTAGADGAATRPGVLATQENILQGASAQETSGSGTEQRRGWARWFRRS
jgi:beta-glucosidase